MTYIEYMNQLWRSALLSPMPASEIALFAYLVNESNKRYWKMPFACSTTRICEDLRLSRQTVITARKHLSERKLIAFTEGKSRHLPSNYTLLEWTDDLTVGLTDNLTHGLTQDLTHIKDKDKHQSKDSFTQTGSQLPDCKHCKVRNRSMWRMRQRQDHYAQGIAEPCQAIGNPQTEHIA